MREVREPVRAVDVLAGIVVVLVRIDRTAVLDEHRPQDRTRLRQRRIAGVRVTQAVDRRVGLHDHVVRFRLALEIIARQGAERGHVQLRRSEELAIRGRAGVMDHGRLAVTTDE